VDALKRFAVIAVAVCGLAAGCHHEDTETADVWPRTVEPRLTGAAWRPCAANCAPVANTSAAECDEIITTDAQAVRILGTQPSCTDSAIAALERLSRTDPIAMSDLAAAYYLRAQRQDQPSDLLRSLQAAEHAVAANPKSPGARFNRALTQEAVGLTAEAIASWNDLASSDPSPWGAEARARSRSLQAIPYDDEKWAANAGAIRAAMREHDVATITRLIAPFPATAEAYLERDLLAQWTAAPTQQHLDDIKTLAASLEPLIGDGFIRDVVDGIAKSPNAVGSPLGLLARFRVASAKSFTNAADALALLDSIEHEARAHGYRHVLSPLRSLRGTILGWQGRYVDALSEYDAAIAEYGRIGDRNGVTGTHSRRIGILRFAGQNELAWREAVQTMHEMPHLFALTDRHVLLGETAATALALGYPTTALLYQNDAVNLIERSGGDHRNLASALRARAGIQLRIGNYDAAVRDIDESLRYSVQPEIARDRSSLQARIDEVRGQALLRTNPYRAVSAFTDALRKASPELSTFHAALLAERGDAQRRAGNAAAAEADLIASLKALGVEESRMLEHRQRGKSEEIWSSYFSRFQDTYRLLIRQLVDEGRAKDAFVYAERARAFEPLDLVEQLDIAPKELRGDVDVDRLQQSLPSGTCILEYTLLDDRTIVWIIARDRFEAVTLRARHIDVERLSGALQSAVRAGNASVAEAQLLTLYDALVAPLLERLDVKPVRLVFVPDGVMHALPFSALRNGKTSRYLIQDAPVEIAASAKLYLFSLLRDRNMATRNQQVLLMGDPRFNPNLPFAQRLKPLPGARGEVDAIYKLYKPHAEKRLGAEATIPQFIELARKSAVVHVAAHAIVNAQMPSRSMILLAPSEHDSGALDAQELLTKVNLNGTRLVVLSTCSSAGGMPIGPEGVAPLVRPIIGAGVPAVIGSLWNVNDATAKELLVSFHRHYREGKDAAIALQSAQLDLLDTTNPGLRSVLAWAPFQVIGHASSPFASTHDNSKEKPP
jgi:CHAT domain-containing protein/tetratricopeptide (TPR) repeat protein